MYTGIKYEIFSLNDRLSLQSGIRLSSLKSSIGKEGYWAGNANYFYWLLQEDGVNTEYLRVKEINQRSAYIGIPVEVRFFTARRPRTFQPYIKMGIEMNFLIWSETEIVFHDPTMEQYEKGLVAKLRQPGKMNFAFYGGAGFKFGRDMNPSVSIEANFPYWFYNPESSGMLHSYYGGGFQISIQIPVK
jgi:hypothetical protein